MRDEYSAAVARYVARVSHRCLAYWDEIGIVKPSVRQARGKGSERLYSFRDLVKLSVVRRLREAGLSIRQIGKGVRALNRQASQRDPLLCEVLLAGGGTMFRRVNEQTLEDVLAQGQMVFSIIALGQVQQETRRLLTELELRGIPSRGRKAAAS